MGSGREENCEESRPFLFFLTFKSYENVHPSSLCFPCAARVILNLISGNMSKSNQITSFNLFLGCPTASSPVCLEQWTMR